MTPMTFGEKMNSLLRQRGLSASAAAQVLGFRSKTAFFRILHDESRMSSIENCFEAACACEALALTGEEIEELRTAMLVSRIGKYAFGVNSILRRVVSGRKPDPLPLDIRLDGSERCKTLEQLFDILPSDKTLDILLLGRCSLQILDRLHRLTQEKNVRQIRHDFSIDKSDLRGMEVLADISSILFCPAYTARFIDETGVNQKNWSYHSGMMVISVHHSDRKDVLLLTKVGEELYYLQRDDTGVLEKYVLRMLDYAADQTQTLKNPIQAEEGTTDIRNYIDFTDRFRELEAGRAIYMIKPDMPINCIPVEVLAPAIVDGFEEAAGCTLEDEAGRQLYRVHEARVANLYGKKKPTHLILNPEAMMDFARRGQRSDHFFLGRRYLPAERVRVLELMREHAKNNPNFSVWFPKNKNIVIDREITIYDGYGVSIIKPDTSWQLERDHQEVMLENRMLADSFRDHLINELINSEMMTKEESIALLDEMILVASQQMQ